MYQNKISYNLVKVDPGIIMCERNQSLIRNKGWAGHAGDGAGPAGGGVSTHSWIHL